MSSRVLDGQLRGIRVLHTCSPPARELGAEPYPTSLLTACCACLRVRAALARLHRRRRRAEATRRHSRVDRTGRLDDNASHRSRRSALLPALPCDAALRTIPAQIDTNALPWELGSIAVAAARLQWVSGQRASCHPGPLKAPAATAAPPSLSHVRPSNACAAWPPSRSPPLSQASRPLAGHPSKKKKGFAPKAGLDPLPP